MNGHERGETGTNGTASAVGAEREAAATTYGFTLTKRIARVRCVSVAGSLPGGWPSSRGKTNEETTFGSGTPGKTSLNVAWERLPGDQLAQMLGEIDEREVGDANLVRLGIEVNRAAHVGIMDRGRRREVDAQQGIAVDDLRSAVVEAVIVQEDIVREMESSGTLSVVHFPPNTPPSYSRVPSMRPGA